ncbi:MAG: ZIP family metal transporter [Actinomycetota bacterium]
MTTWETVLLGAVAGFTIFLGLPMARMRGGGRWVRTFLNGVSAGVLLFLLVEVFEHAFEPLEEAVVDGRWGTVAGMGPLLAGGIGAGLLGLLYVSRMWRRRSIPAGIGPGAMAVAEAAEVHPRHEALNLGMAIATGIGLHNFSEGLAIGQAANTDQISLALLLVIGFGLHNATEGFGIAGPLVAANVRASWRWLIAAGLIGGGPTFLGTLLGTSVSSEYVFVGFLALAAGAILYVVGELFNAGRRLSWDATLWGVAAGFIVGFTTELVLAGAGL